VAGSAAFGRSVVALFSEILLGLGGEDKLLSAFDTHQDARFFSIFEHDSPRVNFAWYLKRLTAFRERMIVKVICF